MTHLLGFLGGNKFLKIDNEYAVYADHAEIIITSPTHGIFNILVDKEDFKWLKSYHWCINKCMNRKTDIYPHFYAGTMQPDQKSKLMHRMLMGNPKGLVVDHINRDTCDNRKANLRCCPQSENGANANLSSANKSGRKGVCLVKNYSPGVDKWKAFIMVNRVNRNLGFFNSFDAAVRRREEEEKRLNRHESQIGAERW